MAALSNEIWKEFITLIYGEIYDMWITQQRTAEYKRTDHYLVEDITLIFQLLADFDQKRRGYYMVQAMKNIERGSPTDLR
jgi:hypothetical protein